MKYETECALKKNMYKKIVGTEYFYVLIFLMFGYFAFGSR